MPSITGMFQSTSARVISSSLARSLVMASSPLPASMTSKPFSLTILPMIRRITRESSTTSALMSDRPSLQGDPRRAAVPDPSYDGRRQLVQGQDLVRQARFRHEARHAPDHA